MKLSRGLLSAVAVFAVVSATAPAVAIPTAPAATRIWDPGTYNWYSGPQFNQLVGYMIVECDGTIRGPYPGPGRPWAEITEYEEFIPLEC